MKNANRFALALTLVLLAPTARADGPVIWPDSPVARLQAFALLEELNADLLSHPSATLTLDRWCADHKLATAATIVAQRDRSTVKAPTDAQRRELGVGPDEAVGYRRVKLSCGGHVLSEADNWYVPSRLTPEMNQVLDTTDTAFGRAVQALNFQRRTLSAELLWRPVPADWATSAQWTASVGKELAIPHEVIQHKAILTLPNGTPFSQVVETYTAAVLDFPVARAP